MPVNPAALYSQLNTFACSAGVGMARYGDRFVSRRPLIYPRTRPQPSPSLVKVTSTYCTSGLAIITVDKDYVVHFNNNNMSKIVFMEPSSIDHCEEFTRKPLIFLRLLNQITNTPSKEVKKSRRQKVFDHFIKIW